MTDIRTSETHPIYADFVPADALGLPGRLGMTFAPGMKATSYKGFVWEREVVADLRELRGSSGTDVLVSLMEDFEYADDHYGLGGVEGFGAAVEAAGIEFRPFPIRDMNTPRPEQNDEYAGFIAGIIASLENGETVVAHCRAGVGRTGTIAASVLIGLGHDPERAIAIVREARSPRMLEAISQEEYVRKFAKGYGGKWKR
ncbi:tyrosine-protein phosphatase [Rubrobacter indicoceani]|uniref:phosphatase domain-containing putative toxin n=1 Tax=Rubrobacter indicoceani TaxID=2051957 RepID=UPI000E5B9315|nr:tyrosine-protein phosphatase [Rubrobacter indicoceani]